MTTPTEIHPQDTVAYSRISIEGLNQEVSLALEGKPLSFQVFNDLISVLFFHVFFLFSLVLSSRWTHCSC